MVMENQPLKADYCRNRVRECERRADDTRDPEVAKEFQATAGIWRELARLAECRGS